MTEKSRPPSKCNSGSTNPSSPKVNENSEVTVELSRNLAKFVTSAGSPERICSEGSSSVSGITPASPGERSGGREDIESSSNFVVEQMPPVSSDINIGGSGYTGPASTKALLLQEQLHLMNRFYNTDHAEHDHNHWGDLDYEEYWTIAALSLNSGSEAQTALSTGSRRNSEVSLTNSKTPSKIPRESSDPGFPRAVNWICPHAPADNNLNTACYGPDVLEQSVIENYLDHLDVSFELGSKQVQRKTSVCRAFIVDKKGQEHDEKRIYFLGDNGETISPWHDVALVCRKSASGDQTGLFNMICEIPRFSGAKMEISTNRTHNPIIQDRTKENLARYYAGPIPWNYGAFPQTWEDPNHIGGKEVAHTYGDGDPLDVVDISRELEREVVVGEVYPVRLLGVLPMLDSGELDWKVIAISRLDRNYSRISDLRDLEEVYPHTLTGVREWFRWYKYTDKKAPLNEFGHMGLILCRCGAAKVLAECYSQWLRLLKSTAKKSREFQLKNRGRIRKLHLMDEFKDDVWTPGHLITQSKGWLDRHIGHIGNRI